MRCARRAALAAAAAAGCAGHGAMTLPPTRQGGELSQGGSCFNGTCLWFSQPAEIPGPPTLNAARERTFNTRVSGGAGDWSRRMPWRAPGTAPVLGSGCGIAGGSPKEIYNGGTPPPSAPQGTDGAALPPRRGAVWRRGAAEEVAWRLTANHGGGYSYRLCPAGGNITEACFQRTVLRFAGATQWIQYDTMWQLAVPDGSGTSGVPPTRTPGPRYEIPLVVAVQPGGAEWARNPIPGCALCDLAACPASDGVPNSPAWQASQHCMQSCAGINMTACPPGMTQFAEPLPGLSGFTGSYVGGYDSIVTAFPYNIIDRVVVPTDIAPGDYLLSWRWDCEQSRQIWQNCADVAIV